MRRELRRDARRYRQAHDATTAALRRIIAARRAEDIARRLDELRALDDLLELAVAHALFPVAQRVAA